MKSLLLFIFLLFAVQAEAQTTGFLTRSNCADITNPATNAVTCQQTTNAGGRGAGLLYNWNGSSWVLQTGDVVGGVGCNTVGSSILKGDNIGGCGNASAGPGGDYVTPSSITGSGLTMSTARLLGRTTAGTGAIGEISVTGCTLSSGVLTCTGTGSGTVTSVALSFTGGLISIGGSPITAAGTIALTVAGTSGGIPYFSSSSTWASSGVLTANLPVIGGGAGAAPTVGTRSGNTTEFATVTGTKTTSKQLAFDVNGNIIASASDIGGGSGSGTVSSGTTNQFAVYTGSTTVGSSALLSISGGVLQVGDVSSKYFTPVLTSADAGSTTLTFPAGGAAVAVAPDTGASNNFLTAISTTGAISKAQPAFTNLSGQATTAQLPSVIDFGAKTSTAPNKVGTSTPGTCAVGDTFFDSDATAGNNIYGCTATNTWTLQGDGGGGGSGDITDVVAGAGMSGGATSGSATVTWDASTFVNNVTLWDGANSTRTLTANLSGTDPIITFGSSSIDVTTGTLKQGGTVVALDTGSNGLVARTGSQATSARTITGTTAQIAVANGSGVSGNPTISLPSDVTISGAMTAGSFQAGASCATNCGKIQSTNVTGIDIYELPELSGSGTSTLVVTANNLSVFAATTSAQLLGVLSDETGTGAAVFANTPTLVTPVLGAATGTSLNLSGLTASKCVRTDASKNLVSDTNDCGGGGGGATFERVSVSRSADTSMATTGDVLVTWDQDNVTSSDVPNASMHSTSTNNSRLIVPSGATKCTVGYNVGVFDTAANLNTYQVKINKNSAGSGAGGTNLGGIHIGIFTGGTTAFATGASTVAFDATAGDYVEFFASLGGGTSPSIRAFPFSNAWMECHS